MAIYTLSKSKSEKWYRIRNLTFILLIILVSTLIGLIGSLLWPSSYESSAVIINANNARIVKINQVSDLVKLESESIHSGLYKLAEATSVTAEQAITEFIAAFSSTDTKRNFYLERELFRLQGYTEPSDSLAYRQAIADFSAQFDYKVSDTIAENPTVTLFFSYQNPEGSAELLNAFIDHAAGIAAANLYQQHQDNLAQLRETLDSATNYYKAIQTDLQKEIRLEEDISINDYYWQQQAQLTAAIRAKQLQVWHLSQSIADMVLVLDDFKPVRIISLANAESSKATPNKVLIVFIILAIGIFLALASILLFRVKEPESI